MSHWLIKTICSIIIVVPFSAVDAARGDSCSSSIVGIGVGTVEACHAGNQIEVHARVNQDGTTRNGSDGSQPGVPSYPAPRGTGEYLDLGHAGVRPGDLAAERPIEQLIIGRLGNGEVLLPVFNADGKRSGGLRQIQFLDLGQEEQDEAPPDETAPITPRTPAPPVDVAAVARQAVATLTLPGSGLGIDPAPEANEWDAAAVGQQLWFWASDMPTQTSNISSQGIDISITAVPLGLTINTGDGNRLICARTDRLTDVFRNQASPSCGHAYAAIGHYGVSASRVWRVTWSAMGQSGAEMLSRSAGQIGVEVIELESLLVPSG